MKKKTPVPSYIPKLLLRELVNMQAKRKRYKNISSAVKATFMHYNIISFSLRNEYIYFAIYKLTVAMGSSLVKRFFFYSVSRQV